MKIKSVDVCKEQAKQFLSLAKQCAENLDAVLSYMYPLSVNITFACELFLKAILLCEKTKENIEIHELRKLFRFMSSEAQNTIKNKFQGDLNNLLKEINKSFENWRYAFEQPVGLNVTNTIRFAEILNEYLDEVTRGDLKR